MDRASHKLDGIPNDTLTSDVVNERAFKVSLSNLDEVAHLVATQLSTIVDSMTDLNNQMALLNARLEEAFETQIKEEDTDVYSRD